MQVASPFLLKIALPVYTETKTFLKAFEDSGTRGGGDHSRANERHIYSQTWLFSTVLIVV